MIGFASVNIFAVSNALTVYPTKINNLYFFTDEICPTPLRTKDTPAIR